MAFAAPQRQEVPMQKGNGKVLGLVFLTVFIDLIGFGIIIPIQPFYAERLGADPVLVTLLGASFSLMQFLFASFWGRLSDRIGRRPIMLTSIATTALGYLAFGFANSLPLLFAARMLAGFGSANIGTAQAIIADSTPPEQRAKGMGMIGAAFGLGFIFGPAIGGIFARYGLSVPIFIAAGFSTLNFFYALFFLPETRPKNAEVARSHRHGGFSWKAFTHAARHPNVPQLFCLYLFFTLAFSQMEQVLGLFIEHNWLLPEAGGSLTEIHAKHAAALTTYVLVVVGVTATIIQGGLIGRLVKKFGEKRLLVFGIFLTGLAMAGIPLTGMIASYNYLLFVAVLLAVGSGCTNPSLSSLLSRSVSSDEQGGSLGLGQSLSALGRVIGPALSGMFFQRSINLPFWVAASLMAVCTFIAFSVKPATPVMATAAR
jgi:MFS transporter, DHA1 family, tetracycline resistance protein